MAEPPDEGAQRRNETQTNPGPSTALASQAAATQQLPADGVRDDQQTTQSGSGHPSQQEPTQQPPTQLQPRLDNVMRALEADANEPAEKRKAEATVLKDQGNQAFVKSDYTRAVELYTQGLERLKDFVVLYTNRAQAYNKLGKFTEAMEDCRTALQLEPNNVKALVHLGKAQQGLKDYGVAVTTYKEITKIDKKYEKMVAGYIAAVNLAESTAKSDMEAERLFSEGDIKAMGVHETGLSEVTDSQAALNQQLPDDQQTTQSGSGQPSQQEPTQQPPPQLLPRQDYPQRSGASIGNMGNISGSHNPIFVGSNVNLHSNVPSEGPEALATKLGRGRPTKVECENNEDLNTLSNYLQNVTPPLEGTSFTLNDVRHHDLTLLKEILLSDSVKSASNIHVHYYLSEKEEEELSLLEETLGVVDVVVLVIAVYIGPQSWWDVGRVSRSFFRMQEQMDSLQFCMVRRSPDEVVDLLKALEGCRLSWLSLYVINLHARLQDINHIPSSLRVLKFYGCKLVDDDVKDLIRILPAGHGLRALVLNSNAFSLDALRALTHHLRGLYSLRALSLSNNGLDPDLVRQVVCHNLPRLKETQQGYFETY